MVATTTLDLRLAGFAPGGYTGTQGAAFTPISVDLAVGDTFDYTIDFKGAQTLTLINASFLWAFSYIASGERSTDVTATGTLSLLDASGNAFLTSMVKTDTEGQAHFGQQYAADFAGGIPPTLTFSGLHYVGTVDAYVDPTVTTRHYDDPAFYFSADANSTSGTVPEPASWLLFVAGFGAVGSMTRRRRTVTVAA